MVNRVLGNAETLEHHRGIVGFLGRRSISGCRCRRKRRCARSDIGARVPPRRSRGRPDCGRPARPSAAESSASIDPPSTTMPSGAPCAASHGGNRDSSGYSSHFQAAKTRRLQTAQRYHIRPAAERAQTASADQDDAQKTDPNQKIARQQHDAEGLGEKKEHENPFELSAYSSYAVPLRPNPEARSMTHHHLHSSPETCHWGFFEAKLKAGPDHRQRRRGDHRHHQRRPRGGAGSQPVSRPA